ncbi:MAG: hypothetical protein ACRDP1_05610 [Nocardioidaceae bacterium]
MATRSKRRRALARAHYERQIARRGRALRRQRVFAIVGWVVLGLIIVAALLWLVAGRVDDGSSTAGGFAASIGVAR